MKTYRLFLGALAGLAAFGTALAADAPAKAGAQVEVIFSQPEKFMDVRDAFSASPKGQEGILAQIRDYLVLKGGNVIPAGQKLTITFTDIDLAGDYEPWHGSQAMDIRVVKDIYPPRMDLEFKLTGADGVVIKEGKRQLRDLAFMAKLSVNREDPLRHEKNMLDDWLKSDFPKAKSG